MYRISVTKAVGGEVVPVPDIEMEDKTDALAKHKEMVEALAEEFSGELMREIGGWAEVFCHGDQGTVAYAKIKRPLHSPTAAVLWGD